MASQESNELARRIVVGLSGPALLPAEMVWLETYRPAGVILFGRNILSFDQANQLCAGLRSIVPHIEIMADHEGGPVSVCSAAIGRPPAPWSLGELNDLGLTRQVHAQTGQRLRALGVDRVLGPCCDVLVEPHNPVIGARAFGADPELVSGHVAAAVAGFTEAGIATTLKHWPGHGGSTSDSHDGAVVVGAGALAAPFICGLTAGADGLMVGHLPVSPTTPLGLPATLDPAAAETARALCAGSDQPPLILFADDVTMGSLRTAMSALGVPAPDAATQGMVEPEDLSPAWLRSLVAGGCDRLLIRGIPWSALPIGESEPVRYPSPGFDDSAGDLKVAQTNDGQPRLEPAPGYDLARKRAARPVTWPELPCAEVDLLWIDATGGDRWGEADPLNSLLLNRFRSVQRQPTDSAIDDLQRFTAILVTSHRPLPEIFSQYLKRTLSEAPNRLSGGILVMGHPSLQDDLRAAQQPSWRVWKLFDVHELDLAAVVNGNS